MKIVMTKTIVGYRNEEPWPERGGEIDLPDHEAKDLIIGGVAKPHTDEVPEDQHPQFMSELHAEYRDRQKNGEAAARAAAEEAFAAAAAHQASLAEIQETDEDDDSDETDFDDDSDDEVHPAAKKRRSR